jgi:lipid-binding SYLF domain-containing protein
MRLAAIAVCILFSAAQLPAETAQERLGEATQIFNEIMAAPDKGIPQDLLESAHCIAIVPGLKKAAFVVGGQYGRGFVLCRSGSGRGWGAPAAIRVEGGSVGFQIGGSETDVVMLVMNERGKNKLMESKFTIGADLAVAAGPVGRTANAATDAQMRAEILAWSRSRGLFAGISLSGATMRNDLDENKELYGREVHNREVISGAVQPPPAAQPLLTALNKYSRREEGRSADRTVDKK